MAILVHKTCCWMSNRARPFDKAKQCVPEVAVEYQGNARSVVERGLILDRCMSYRLIMGKRIFVVEKTILRGSSLD